MNQHYSHTLRLTAGLFKGQEISTPKSAHPMGSRERLALMNSLSPYLKGAKVLDAFAGSGALGIEALSRGAKTATFIEKDCAAAQTIAQNLTSLSLTSAKVVKQDVKSYQSRTKYDIIIVDPPYNDFHPAAFIHLQTFLAPGGVFALSHPGTFTPQIPGLVSFSTKKYARCHITLFTKS